MMRALFLPLTPVMGHYSSHCHQCLGTIPPTNHNDGALFLPLIPVMGHYSSYSYQ
ncbi:unnamed protein product [Staurois parvus]|uniref:Uncharacterized protein n=1 Tax=Staurois parvus TaxID=386267 RepID=A0ABN9FR39_9NEOB|nr:unnamed protein product [Staurois parvus]